MSWVRLPPRTVVFPTKTDLIQVPTASFESLDPRPWSKNSASVGVSANFCQYYFLSIDSNIVYRHIPARSPFSFLVLPWAQKLKGVIRGSEDCGDDASTKYVAATSNWTFLAGREIEKTKPETEHTRLDQVSEVSQEFS